MNAMNRLLGGTIVSLALMAGGLVPAFAGQIAASGKHPRIAATTTSETSVVLDFGNDTSHWAKDGECDDPRFMGAGSAVELVDTDLLKDATDCQAAFEAGTVTLKDAPPTSPADIAIASPIDAIDFGDDSSKWARDGECDDPRFLGNGSAAELVQADQLKDATDCRAAYAAGTVTLRDTASTPQGAPAGGPNPSDIAITTPIDAINFGDDSSEYAKDGECDDPRFMGAAMGAEPLQSNTSKDATDCRAAYQAGTVTLNNGTAPADIAAAPASTEIDYGDDTSEWAKDEECDDPRFSGTGVASQLLDEDKGHDATDCRAAVAAGTATFNGASDTAAPTVVPFDYGSDTSKWANDGECDDLRFTGTGVDKKLLPDDTSADATDCRAAVTAGTATIRAVYSPEFAAGAPYDSSGIDFGDNSSDYADDAICDDPRFEGPDAASVLLESDLKHDSADCKTAYEAGRIVLIGTSNG